jgi:hypothetical protein
MMTWYKSIMIGLFLAVALSAAATSSASAAQETRWFVEGTELKTTETVDGAIGVAGLNSTLLGAKILIECVANHLVPTGVNTIEAEGQSRFEITYSQCYVYTISKGTREPLTSCGVEPIQFQSRGQLIAGPGGVAEGEGKPASGTLFVEISIVNANGKTCVLKSRDKVEGTYIASGGAEGERSMTEHILTARSTGSKLTFAKEPASYFQDSTNLKLRSGRAFYAG